MERLHRPLPVDSSLRPTRPCRSSSVTRFRGSERAVSAAIRPEAPPPMMQTSLMALCLQPLAGEIALQHQGRRHGVHHLFALFGVLSIVK